MAEDGARPTDDAGAKLLELRAEFEAQATPLDRLTSRATALLSRPLVAIVIGVVATAWAIGNFLAPGLGYRPWDPPPFQAMQAFGTVAAVVIATLILAGQRRDDEAARRRSQLTVQLAAEAEQKIAKLIGLMEEQRRHNPMLPDRDDAQAERMAQPAEPRQILDRIFEGEEPHTS